MDFNLDFLNVLICSGGNIILFDKINTRDKYFLFKSVNLYIEIKPILNILWVMVTDLKIHKRIWFISKVFRDHNSPSSLILIFLSFNIPYLKYKKYFEFYIQIGISILLFESLFLNSARQRTDKEDRGPDSIFWGLIDLLNRIKLQSHP